MREVKKRKKKVAYHTSQKTKPRSAVRKKCAMEVRCREHTLLDANCMSKTAHGADL